MMIWVTANPECLGFLPSFLSDTDPRSAKEQLDANYQGGWMSLPGVEALADGTLCYPGDPPLEPLAEARLRDEVIRVFDCSFVSITQPDGSFEVARLD